MRIVNAKWPQQCRVPVFHSSTQIVADTRGSFETEQNYDNQLLPCQRTNELNQTQGSTEPFPPLFAFSEQAVALMI